MKSLMGIKGTVLGTAILGTAIIVGGFVGYMCCYMVQSHKERQAVLSKVMEDVGSLWCGGSTPCENYKLENFKNLNNGASYTFMGALRTTDNKLVSAIRANFCNPPLLCDKDIISKSWIDIGLDGKVDYIVERYRNNKSKWLSRGYNIYGFDGKETDKQYNNLKERILSEGKFIVKNSF